MGHNESYESKIKGVYKGMIFLGFITLVEVAFSLFGKGHLGIEPSNYLNVTLPSWLPLLGGTSFNIILLFVAFALIALSVYKAYFIIYEFMHMGHEAKGLQMTVLLPVLLLVWGIIAFFHEGGAWKGRRDKIDERNKMDINDTAPSKTGMLYEHPDWQELKG